MKIKRTRAVDSALRTLTEEECRGVEIWFDRLAKWEQDELIRKMTRKMPGKETYILNTSDDIRIFFDLKEAAEEIVIVDLSKPSRFATVATVME